MDILERLRKSAHWLVTNTTVPTEHIQVMDDAYDMIEQLRGKLTTVRRNLKQIDERKPLTSYKDMYGL